MRCSAVEGWKSRGQIVKGILCHAKELASCLLGQCFSSSVMWSQWSFGGTLRTVTSIKGVVDQVVSSCYSLYLMG